NNSEPDPLPPGMTHLGVLEVDGALDWWRLDHEGQYLIGLSKEAIDNGFALTVYHHANMSEPVKNDRDEEFTIDGFGAIPGISEGEVVVGAKYSLLFPPYYIKI